MVRVAHWDDERDARWVRNARETTLTPEMKKWVDKFEKTGDLIHWNLFLDEIRKKADQLRVQSSRQAPR